MALNPDTSKAILLGTRQRAHSYCNLSSVNVAGCQIYLADHIRILGVTIDNGGAVAQRVEHWTCVGSNATRGKAA